MHIESGNNYINIEVSMYYYLRKLSRWQSKKNRPPKAGFHQFWPQKKFIFCQSWFEKSLDSCVLNGDAECQVRFQTQIFICKNEKWKNGHTSHAKKHQWEFYPVPLLLRQKGVTNPMINPKVTVSTWIHFPRLVSAFMTFSSAISVGQTGAT